MDNLIIERIDGIFPCQWRVTKGDKVYDFILDDIEHQPDETEREKELKCLYIREGEFRTSSLINPMIFEGSDSTTIFNFMIASFEKVKARTPKTKQKQTHGRK